MNLIIWTNIKKKKRKKLCKKEQTMTFEDQVRETYI